MEYATDYYWVVICKNRCLHHKGNTSYEHHIPLPKRTLTFTADADRGD